MERRAANRSPRAEHAKGAGKDVPSLEPLEEHLPLGDQPDLYVRPLTASHTAHVEYAHLVAMRDLGERLMHTPDARTRLRLICEALAGTAFKATGVVVLRVLKANGSLEVKPLVRPFMSRDFDMMPLISRSVLKSVIRNNVPVLATVGGESQPGSIEMTFSPDRSGVAVMACPLGEGHGYRDLIYASFDDCFASLEWLALVTMVVQQYQQCETALDARRQAEIHAVLEQDLLRAQQIQSRLIPHHATVPGLDIALSYQPSRWVGGDYVDVIPIADGWTVLIVADVCGKGLGAAMVCSNVHAMTHTALRAGAPLENVIAGLNDHLLDYVQEGSFVTLVAIAIHPETGRMRCINAGHLPPIVVGSSGVPVLLQHARYMPLGLGAQEFEAQESRLERDQVLALYTDGLTELKDASGHMTQIKGLSDHLQSLHNANTVATAAELTYQLNRWLDTVRGDQTPEDDRTFLLARLQ